MKEIKTAAIMASLNPDEKMMTTVADLKAAGFKRIILIDDGSCEETKHFFTEAEEKYGCELLVHAVNQGQGRAIKNAFNYLLLNGAGEIGAVTIDSDGQHSAEDAVRLAEALEENPECFVIGCRDFSQKNVPLRSRMGNVITRNVFRFLCGIKISDTQTGLRAYSLDLMRRLILAPGDRYEFCSSTLIEAKKADIPFKEVKISTIYIEGNKSSHFNVLRDSFRIYALILKFLTASISSFVVDILLFTLISSLIAPFSLVSTAAIAIATYAARLGSSIFNYKVNRNLVFKKGRKSSAAKYILLCVIQATLSYVGVYFISSWAHANPVSLNTVWIKVLVDFILFMLSFVIQREWVFKNKKGA